MWIRLQTLWSEMSLFQYLVTFFVTGTIVLIFKLI